MRDADIVFRRVQQLLRELNQPAETITEADVRLYCRHAHDLYLIRGSSISDEYQGRNTNLQNIGRLLFLMKKQKIVNSGIKNCTFSLQSQNWNLQEACCSITSCYEVLIGFTWNIIDIQGNVMMM